jgi:hypothetical protein
MSKRCSDKMSECCGDETSARWGEETRGCRGDKLGPVSCHGDEMSAC